MAHLKAIHLVSAGSSIIDIMNYFLGCIFSSVLMICINRYSNSILVVYCQDTSTDNVRDT